MNVTWVKKSGLGIRSYTEILGMTYKVSHHLFVLVMFFQIFVTLGTHHGPTLRVISQKYWANYTHQFTCEGLDEALHPLGRRSWILITGKEEKQLNYNTRDHGSTLDLLLKPEMHGAKLSCRAHATTPRLHVMLAPPIPIRLYKPGNKMKPVSRRIVKAQIGNESFSEEGAVSRHAGADIDVNCFATGLGRDINVYMYILLRNENGNIETEIAGVAVNSTRLWKTSGRLKARVERNNSQIYCLARWFTNNDTTYQNSTALRSAPVTLVIEPTTPGNQENKTKDENSLLLWIVVGVAAVGWLIALIMIGRSLCLRDRRNENTPRNSTEVAQQTKYECTFACGGDGGSNTSSTHGPGATVLPTHAARDLATANVKLTYAVNPNVNHTPTAPLPEECATYCNVQELNSLLRRKQF